MAVYYVTSTSLQDTEQVTSANTSCFRYYSTQTRSHEVLKTTCGVTNSHMDGRYVQWAAK